MRNATNPVRKAMKALAEPTRTGLAMRSSAQRASRAAALLLALAGPGLAAEVPWTRNLAGKFSAGPVYSGALVWDLTGADP